MYKTFAPLLLTVVLIGGCTALDGRTAYPIDPAVKAGREQGYLDPAVSLQFGRGRGDVVQSGITINESVNRIGKNGEEACNTAFLMAVRQLQNNARAAGAGKVINIVSHFDRSGHVSSQRYECHLGPVNADVSLKGDLAR